MKQYEIWWAKLPPPAGERPVLLLSRDEAYTHLNKFVAAEITPRVRGIRTELRLGSREGLHAECAANFDKLLSVAQSWLIRRLGALDRDRVPEAKRALGYALRWPELTGRERC